MAGVQWEDLLLTTESPLDTETSGKDFLKKSSTRIQQRGVRSNKNRITDALTKEVFDSKNASSSGHVEKR